MTKTIDFFFDFLSPYAYLAHQRLPELADKYGYQLSYKPIDLKRAKLAAGNTAPPTREMPVKLRYALTDLKRWADIYGVPFAVAKSTSGGSERLNKGTLFATDRNQVADYVAATWGAIFGAGGDMGNEALISQVAESMGWPVAEYFEFIDSDEAGRRYAANNQEAEKRGVFGVPAMLIGQEMWWGNDRLDMLERYLKSS